MRRAWLGLTAVMLTFLVAMTPPASGYNKALGFTVARQVVDNLPQTWRTVFKGYMTIIETSLSEQYDLSSNLFYNPEKDVGDLMERAVNRYSMFVEDLDSKDIRKAAEDMGALIFFVVALSNPFRLGNKTSVRKVNMWGNLLRTYQFRVKINGSEGFTDLRSYLRGLALYAYRYRDEAESYLNETKPSPGALGLAHRLLTKATVAAYSVVVSALNTHFNNMLPISIAWVLVAIIAVVVARSYRELFLKVRRVFK